GAAVELEVAPGEIIVSAHQVGAPCEPRGIGIAADAEVGCPTAADPEARDPEVAAGHLHVELPGVKVRSLDHVFRIEPAITHLELRDGCRGRGAAELE